MLLAKQSLLINLNAYEFRVINMSDYSDDSQDMQTFMWNGLKCLISEDTHYQDVTVIAITVRGSESLSELGDNQISTLWTRRLASLKDVKTTTYQDVRVQGTDKFSYGGIELFDEIMNNLQYPSEAVHTDAICVWIRGKRQTITPVVHQKTMLMFGTQISV